MADVPKGKRWQDYGDWMFVSSVGLGRVDVHFSDESKKVHSVSCFGKSFSDCPPILGIAVGTLEADVIQRLGAPSKQEIAGASKTLAYRKLNVSFLLEKQRVYMLILKDSTRN